MALEPPTVEKTIRVWNEVREAMDRFLEAPLTEAREADVMARIVAYRLDVAAGRLPLPRVIHRNEPRRRR